MDSLVAPKLLLCSSDLRVFLEASVALIVGEGVPYWEGHWEKLLFLQAIIGIFDLLEFKRQHLQPIFILGVGCGHQCSGILHKCLLQLPCRASLPTLSRCRATSSVEPLLGVGTTFTKVALLGSYSCQKPKIVIEPFLTQSACPQRAEECGTVAPQNVMVMYLASSAGLAISYLITGPILES